MTARPRAIAPTSSAGAGTCHAYSRSNGLSDPAVPDPVAIGLAAGVEARMKIGRRLRGLEHAHGRRQPRVERRDERPSAAIERSSVTHAT